MTDGIEEIDLVPRLLRFLGKQEDWRMWSRKFLARASTIAYLNILTGLERAPPVLEGSTTETIAEEKERISTEEKVIKGNSLGYFELLSAVFDDISFNIVVEARSKDFPDGDCALAWEGLMRTFEPTTSASKVALKKKFTQTKLGDPNQDPTVWITELELVRLLGNPIVAYFDNQ
jgi:hypothetical protein